MNKLTVTGKKLADKLQRYRAAKKQRGMTLLEVIIVLGIIGVIAAGVVILAQRAYDSKARTDLSNNINIIRTAMKDAYGMQALYPLRGTSNATTLTPATFATNTDTVIGKLGRLGKVSMSEAQNPISGDFFSIGAATVAGADRKGYWIEVNGLDAGQCRALLNQEVNNNWDYVAVIGTTPRGTATTVDGLNLSEAAVADTIGAITAAGILRSLDPARPSIQRAPDEVAMMCADNSANAILLGSR